MMDVPRPNGFTVALAFLVAALPFADVASAQGRGASLLSWLRSNLERVEVTERPRSADRPRRPVPRGEESGDLGQRPTVVLDERNRRGDRARRPRGRDRQNERIDREERADRRGRGSRRGGSAKRRSERAGGSQGGPNGKRQSGPPFCHSGSGHPVFGMEWCRERGFAPQAGSDRRYEQNRRFRRWNRQYEERSRRQERRREPGDITFEGLSQRRDARLSEGKLEDVLGPRVFGRFERQARRFGSDSDLSGRWVGDRDEQVLRVQVGPRLFAELIDGNRDGRVDRAVLAEPSRER